MTSCARGGAIAYCAIGLAILDALAQWIYAETRNTSPFGEPVTAVGNVE